MMVKNITELEDLGIDLVKCKSYGEYDILVSKDKSILFVINNEGKIVRKFLVGDKVVLAEKMKRGLTKRELKNRVNGEVVSVSVLRGYCRVIVQWNGLRTFDYYDPELLEVIE